MRLVRGSRERRRPRWRWPAAAALTLAAAAPAADAQLPDPDGYCVPQNTRYDPADVQRPGAPPVELPPGVRMRRITVGGFSTIAFEAGPPTSTEAVVFMHGNPGSSLDFLELLRAVPAGTRLIAFDILGFGRADKPYDFPYTFEASRPVLDRAFRELGIRRMHLVGHDVGSVVGVDWAARHPESLGSAVLIAGGLMIGYQDHHFARVWKTPKLGEISMSGVTRERFVQMIQLHNPRPLPREFLDRNYDGFDRATRCAILKIYRGQPDLDELSRSHAAALRPYDRPALVLWGDRDPFVPFYVAEGSRQAFPRADVHIFENSGHWPFVDEPQRAAELVGAFLRRHVAEQAGARIGLTVRPAARRGSRRAVLHVRTTVGAAALPLAGAVVRAAGRRAVTDADGHARLVVRAPRRGALRVTASKVTLVTAVETVAARARRARRRAAAAPAGTRQVVELAFTSAEPGAATGMRFDARWRNPADPEGKPHAMRQIVSHLPEGFVYDTTALERCHAADLELVLRGASACPADSVVSRGTLLTDNGEPSPFPRHMNLSLTMFNTAYGFVSLAEALDRPFERKLRVVARNEIRGRTVTSRFPAFPSLSEPDRAMAFARMRVGSEPIVRDGRAYARLPATCPAAGHWTTTMDFLYKDGRREIVEARSPCTSPGDQGRRATPST